MRRWGLRGRMAASYVLVTAAAVLVMEIVAVVLAGALLTPAAEENPTVAFTARDLAARAGDAAVHLGRLPGSDQLPLGERGIVVPPGQTLVTPDGGKVRIPIVDTAQDDGAPMTLALLLDPDLTIVASSYPARYPPGTRAGGSGSGPLAANLAPVGREPKGMAGRAKVAGGEVLWAAAAVYPLGFPEPDGPKGSTEPVATDGPLGEVYVQAPVTPALLAAQSSTTRSPWQSVLPLLGVGLLILLAALPVGVVFGLLSTRSPIRRLRQLATSTVEVAAGQYQHRVPVSGSDEITTLEVSFNRMAERLSTAVVAERQLASAGERARIARELHDSISQDLFSLRLLAGGLRRALPAQSPLYQQVEAMERTATGTMHEMQALLLELRPVALRDAGLVPAIEELCQAYRERLGVTVDTELAPVELDTTVEHAVLRIVQEALANAVKHARPNRITVRMRGLDGRVTVSITDDGAGFDPDTAAGRHGMGLALMRERVTELGGTIRIDSAPARGTTITFELPGSRP
jgi:signal transduction histidine kinase